jgi:hypothetical protein
LQEADAAGSRQPFFMASREKATARQQEKIWGVKREGGPAGTTEGTEKAEER